MDDDDEEDEEEEEEDDDDAEDGVETDGLGEDDEEKI